MLRISAERDDSNYEFRATPNHICFGTTIKYKSDKKSISLNVFGDFETFDTGEVLHVVSRKSDSQNFGWFDNIDRAEEAARKAAKAHDTDIARFAMFVTGGGFRFMPAADLEVEMGIPVTKNEGIEDGEITNITEEHYDGLVYDLDIPEARNFAANGVLVHNSMEAWRAADDPFILDFEKRYPDAQIVRLEQNYRSTQNILDAAHGVIDPFPECIQNIPPLETEGTYRVALD